MQGVRTLRVHQWEDSQRTWTNKRRSFLFLGDHHSTIDVVPAVEVCRQGGSFRFKGSKGDQKRFGAAVIPCKISDVCPAKMDWEWKKLSMGLQRGASLLGGCGGFEVMLALMVIQQQLGPGEPLAAYGKEDR